MKIITKVITNKIKPILSSTISENQIALVQKKAYK